LTLAKKGNVRKIYFLLFLLTNVKSLKFFEKALLKRGILYANSTAKTKHKETKKVLGIVFNQNLYFSALKKKI